ncbi:DUF3597 domain-containing protein [Altererythrobacter aquiaggeris]|uniref:DUF3597 domain-containing protein n=1 Tax=Aestuarierythrobacter aquiaggeris TaxID=1898396 RepID=UPI0030194598
MGIFSSIKDAIFGKQAKAATPPVGTAPIAPSASSRSVSVSEVDVEAQLDAMSGADKLNWRSSIVDLLKLLGIDASYANRKELAQELGNSDYSGSAEDNILLHKQTMQELSRNGGKVPAEFLD